MPTARDLAEDARLALKVQTHHHSVGRCTVHTRFSMGYHFGMPLAFDEVALMSAVDNFNLSKIVPKKVV